MIQVVLDTSVVLKWFCSVEEGDLETALRLRKAMFAGTCLAAAPDLMVYELGNALIYNPRLTGDEVKSAVDSLLDMGIQWHHPTPALMKKATDIALACGVTVYDASFLGLATIQNVPLITADYKSFEKLRNMGTIVRLDKFDPGG